MHSKAVLFSLEGFCTNRSFTIRICAVLMRYGSISRQNRAPRRLPKAFAVANHLISRTASVATSIASASGVKCALTWQREATTSIEEFRITLCAMMGLLPMIVLFGIAHVIGVHIPFELEGDMQSISIG